MSPRTPLVLLVVASVIAGCTPTRSLPICDPPSGIGVAPAPMPEATPAPGDEGVRPSRGSTVVYASPPRLVSPTSAANAVERRYPRRLREAGIGGAVVVRALVSADGRVEDAKVWQSSGKIDLDRAALEAVLAFRYDPAVTGGCPAAAWIQLPIRFSVEAPAEVSMGRPFPAEVGGEVLPFVVAAAASAQRPGPA